jgi:hypothetical protein
VAQQREVINWHLEVGLKELVKGVANGKKYFQYHAIIEEFFEKEIIIIFVFANDVSVLCSSNRIVSSCRLIFMTHFVESQIVLLLKMNKISAIY